MKILGSYKVAAAVALIFAGSSVFAQGITDNATNASTDDAVNKTWKPSLVKDGVFDRAPHDMSTLTWQPIREADVMWKKRVWREIDPREKQNLPFRYPGDENTGGGYFIEILMDAVKKGKLKAYSALDDRFTNPMDAEAIKLILTGKDDTTEVYDPATNTTKLVITHKDFDPDQVTKYRIKEDWVFDRNVGRMVVHIVGIAPFIDVRDPTTNELRGQSALFYLYYPDSRETLAKYEVFNPDNDVQRLTWDDFFEGRYFSSRIVKISNPFDQYIQNMPGINPMEALYENNRNAEMIFTKEHDMWVY